MKKLLEKLKEPYPLRERTWKQALLHSLLEGFFIYLFLIIFQPFGIKEWQDPNKYFLLLWHGLVVSFSLIVIRKLLPLGFGFFRDENKWTLSKEILQALILLMLITLGLLVINKFFFGMALGLNQLFKVFLSVSLIAVFPIIFWVLADHNYKLKKYQAGLDLRIVAPVEHDPIITILADNAKDTYTFKATDLLFIEAQENYCQIVLLDKGYLPEFLIRSSLAKIEEQLTLSNLKRLHRSYIVNTTKIEKVTGNAQGYKLKLIGHNDLIPVGRSYSETLKGL